MKRVIPPLDFPLAAFTLVQRTLIYGKRIGIRSRQVAVEAKYQFVSRSLRERGAAVYFIE